MSNDYFKKGVCFMCREPCAPDAMLHFSCGLAHDEALRKKTEEERIKNKGTIRET